MYVEPVPCEGEKHLFPNKQKLREVIAKRLSMKKIQKIYFKAGGKLSHMKGVRFQRNGEYGAY